MFGATLHDEATGAEVPQAAIDASLGCGVPTAVADLHEGETVLDLGSGAGADVLISARRVGATAKAIGLDMTDEMLDFARANAAQAGFGIRRVPQGRLRVENIDQDPRLDSLYHAVSSAKAPTTQCCEPAALASCCAPANKADCCGAPDGTPPRRCGCGT